MKSNKIYNLSLAAAVAIAAVACEPKLDAPTPSTGTTTKLDFSRYVSVGNSLTAGYADGGLYRYSQQNSYPSMLAAQFAQAGGGSFEQPLFTEAQKNGSGYLSLTGFTATGSPVMTPVTTSLAVTGMGFDSKTPVYAPYTVTTTGQVTPNNLGVPGIRLADIKTAGYGYNNPAGFNPYFQRMLSATSPSPTGYFTTYLQFVSQSKPTFFSNWLGNNDVLGFSTSGGDLNNDGTTDYAGLTSTTLFKSLYTELLDTLTNNKKRAGVVANIPYVTSIPFFTTVTKAAVLKSAPANSKLYVKTDVGTRELTDADLILLTTQSVIGRVSSADSLMLPVGPGGSLVKVAVPHGFSQYNPLTNKEVLDSDEVAAVKTRVDELNAIIKQSATDYNLAFVDANTYLEKIKSGTAVEGISISAGFITGGAFSLDGVHLTPRGYALIANKFIEAINTKYGSSVPTVNVSEYNAVVFPK